MSAAQEMLPDAANVSAPPWTGDDQEAAILLSDAQAPQSLVAIQRSWWPLRAASGALLLACLLAAAAGAVVTTGSPAASRSTNPAQLRRLDRGDGFVDSRNPSLRRAATEAEGNIADDIAAVFSVQGVSLFDEDEADGTDEAQLDAQPRAPIRREEQGEKGTRDERSFDRAFQDAGGAEDSEKTVLEKLIRDLPSGRRLLGALS